ncbi:hypothetical protein B0H13DRAFT_2309809 [Mycena leptocephala]|nr:hypothetical protein B0H13DRAFT_2309809 [Mycena leptocephala]
MTLAVLQLTDEKWARVDLFVHVLKSAEKAQSPFSADFRSTLHLAIPALENLHAAWTRRTKDVKSLDF